MTQRLKSGFTTGTAAAAAAKAALQLLCHQRLPEQVTVRLLNGQHLSIPVDSGRIENQACASCLVRKDAGDDPDITHRALIGARVSIVAEGAPGAVIITGGHGVGIVTRPGLEVPPGKPAINSGPRRMITWAVEDARPSGRRPGAVQVEIFVPEGKRLARKTLNARLGIIGGLSILGTTGIVKPLSHEAYTATIRSALSVARASGLDAVVLTTGRRSERFAQDLWPQLPEFGFVQIGDYFRFAVQTVVAQHLKALTLVVFFGKALKMAQGIPHTHASKAALSLAALSDWILAQGGLPSLAQAVRQANTARHAFELLGTENALPLAIVGRRVVAAAKAFSKHRLAVRSVILDYEGHPVYDSEQQG